VPPDQPADIGTALAPGNRGLFTVEGQARGTATDDPRSTARTSTTSA
jgi:hypothetical protein